MATPMQQTDNQAPMSRRQKVMSGLSTRHPDLNMEDEEAVFGAIDDDYGQLEQSHGRYKGAVDKLLETFDKDPRAMDMFVQLAKNGTSPLEYIFENYGEEARAAFDDPAVAKKLAEKNNIYLETVAKDKELRAEAEANLKQTVADFEAAASELGLDDSQKQKAFEWLAQVQDDMIRDKVSTDIWKLIMRGLNYETDMADAQATGEVRGRNAKISEKLRRTQAPAGMPAALTGQGGAKPQAQRRANTEGFVPEDKDWLKD